MTFWRSDSALFSILDSSNNWISSANWYEPFFAMKCFSISCYMVAIWRLEAYFFLHKSAKYYRRKKKSWACGFHLTSCTKQGKWCLVIPHAYLFLVFCWSVFTKKVITHLISFHILFVLSPFSCRAILSQTHRILSTIDSWLQ